MPEPSLALLSRLWLREPDSRTLEDCRALPDLARRAVEPAALAAAYADLFLLNVYPYGTAFTDPSGELGGPSAEWAAQRFENRGYRPPELLEVGAPDHVGLCLAYLDHLEARGKTDDEFASFVLEWVPVCCLAVEREPAAHPFYRAVAAATRERLLDDSLLSHSEEPASPCHSEERSDEESVASSKGPQIPRSARDDNQRRRGGVPRDDTAVADEEEVGLSNVVRFLLAPARSGIFFSRGKIGHLARGAGMRLPFGSRFDVAHLLFQTAGEGGKVGTVLDLLGEEVGAWETAYRSLSDEYPRWAPVAARWLGRTEETRRRLGAMREVLENPPELELADGRRGEGSA